MARPLRPYPSPPPPSSLVAIGTLFWQKKILCGPALIPPPTPRSGQVTKKRTFFEAYFLQKKVPSATKLEGGGGEG